MSDRYIRRVRARTHGAACRKQKAFAHAGDPIERCLALRRELGIAPPHGLRARGANHRTAASILRGERRELDAPGLHYEGCEVVCAVPGRPSHGIVALGARVYIFRADNFESRVVADAAADFTAIATSASVPHRLVAGTDHGDISLIDTHVAQCVRAWHVNGVRARALALSRATLFANVARTTLVYDARAVAPVARIAPENALAVTRALAMCEDGDRIAVGYNDPARPIAVYDHRAWTRPLPMPATEERARAFAWRTPDELVVGGGSLARVDLTRASTRVVWRHGADARVSTIKHVARVSDNAFIVATDERRFATLFELRESANTATWGIATAHQLSTRVHHLAACPGLVLAGCESELLRVWSTERWGTRHREGRVANALGCVSAVR